MTRPRTLWWVLIAVLTVTAGEAEHVRRATTPSPGPCIGSAVLLGGSGCARPARPDSGSPL